MTAAGKRHQYADHPVDPVLVVVGLMNLNIPERCACTAPFVSG